MSCLHSSTKDSKQTNSYHHLQHSTVSPINKHECIGLLTTKIFIQQQEEPCIFYVTNINDCAHEVILGRSWMAKHQCSIDWAKNVITLHMNNQRFTILPNNPAKVSTHEAATITFKPKAKHIPKQPRYATPNICKGGPKSQHRLVPVKLLKSQGYYHGCQQIWIPKQRAIIPTQKLPQSSSTKDKRTHTGIN